MRFFKQKLNQLYLNCNMDYIYQVTLSPGGGGDDVYGQKFNCPDCNNVFKTKTALNFHRLKVKITLSYLSNNMNSHCIFMPSS